MKPISLLDRLPPPSVMDHGDEEVWWFNRHDYSWTLGSPLLFDEQSIISEDAPDAKYTHWLPEYAIQMPDVDEV